MKPVILVPRRADGGHRDRLWKHCKAEWAKRLPGVPVVEGHHDDGPFNRSAAINAAAAAAGDDWDVALIVDGDTISDPTACTRACELALSTGHMVVAHDQRVMLSREGTRRVMDGDTGSWRRSGFVETVYTDSVSCAVAVTREVWEAVGGFDELFSGWGYEDSAFTIAVEALTGLPPLRVVAETFHLWHPVSAEAAKDAPTRKANAERLERYRAANRDKEAVGVLLAEARRAAAGLGTTPIPPTLWRTVPAETTPEVEAWWNAFRGLHPAWDLRTVREPVLRRDFPVSGSLFDRCRSGAQKAGLIRLELLVTHGGVYVDSDCEPFRPLDPLLHCRAFAGWEDAKVVPDAVLGAAPQHPAFVAALEEACRLVASGKDEWVSGPGVTTQLLPGRDDVLVLPPGAFYPMHYLDRDTRELVVADRPPWAFLIHHYRHSWGTDAQKAAITARQRQA